MFDVSLGIMAYNEEANIGLLLHSIIEQKLTHASIKEIIVVASGCSDSTENIVRSFIQKDRRIKLLIQTRREGKASAINLFLSKASGDILILESADTIPVEDALDKLVAPFYGQCVGMTGAHPVPVNQKNTFIGFTVHLMWSLHHRIALVTPKLGELVAFRNLVQEIPNNSAVDEASIEAIITEKGFELRYVSDAFVSNKGPDNIKDFIKQRRRIAAGHKHLLHTHNYKVSTYNTFRILNILVRQQTWKFKNTAWTFGAIALETIGRILGYYDFYIRKKNPVIWDIASSTKRLD